MPGCFDPVWAAWRRRNAAPAQAAFSSAVATDLLQHAATQPPGRLPAIRLADVAGLGTRDLDDDAALEAAIELEDWAVTQEEVHVQSALPASLGHGMCVRVCVCVLVCVRVCVCVYIYFHTHTSILAVVCLSCFIYFKPSSCFALNVVCSSSCFAVYILNFCSWLLLFFVYIYI